MTEWLAALRKAFARGFTLLARFAGGMYSIAGVSQPGASACVLMSSPRCLACRCGREATAAVPGADLCAAGCRSWRERRWPLTEWPLALQALFSTNRRPSIAAHNRIICARPSAQRTLLTAAPIRRYGRF